jgi:hypothetical protein
MESLVRETAAGDVKLCILKLDGSCFGTQSSLSLPSYPLYKLGSNMHLEALGVKIRFPQGCPHIDACGYVFWSNDILSANYPPTIDFFLAHGLGHLPICSRILSVDAMLKSRVWVLRGECAKECKSEGFEASSYEVCRFVPAKQDGRWAHFLVKFTHASLTHLYNPIFFLELCLACLEAEILVTIIASPAKPCGYFMWGFRCINTPFYSL